MKSFDRDITTHQFTLDRIEGDKAVLIRADQEIILPKKMLPKGVKDGSVLILTIATSEAETERREKKAKELLNEILGANK